MRAVVWVLLFGALAACGGEGPPAAQADAIPPCADSRGKGCDNGLPLCMMDEERACSMCHCSAYALVAPPVDTTIRERPIPALGK